jgi:hypothetical protein
LQYHSLDEFIGAKLKTSTAGEPGNAPAEEDAQSLGKRQADHHTTSKPATTSSLSKKRLKLLFRHYQSQRGYLRTLSPLKVWDNRDEAEFFAHWIASWIWTSLAEESGAKESLTGYIALSYAWSRQPNIPDKLARQMKLHRIFQDISPTCADLLAKEMPSVAQVPAGLNNETEIILDGVRISIGKNLESAFRALREIPEVQSGMLVWADALCINQKDIDERNF